MEAELIEAVRSVAAPKWTEVATFWVMLLSLVGLVVIFHQSLCMRLALQCQTHANLFGQDAQLINLLLSKPELRPHFYENKPVDVQGPDAERVRLVAEAIVSYCENIALQQKNLDRDVRAAWKRYVRTLWDDSHAVREHYARFEQCYSPALRQVLDEMKAIVHTPEPYVATASSATAAPGSDPKV